MSADPTKGIKESLSSIDPYEFEHFVADLWERRGWEAEVSSESRDAGIDVTVRQSNPFDQTQIIQAKRYKPDNKVSSSDIQQYASLQHQVPDADSVIVVTTSDFTTDARQRANELNVKLVNGNSLLRIIEEEDAHDLVNRYTEVDVETTTSEPTTEDSSVDVVSDDTEEEMSTSEAIVAVIQGLIALSIVVFILYLVVQAVIL